MRLDINLATQPYEDSRRFWLQWGGALAGLGVVTLALLYLTFNAWLAARKDRALIGQYEQQIAERDKERDDAQALMNAPQNANTRDRSQFLNDLFYRKAFSWTRVFENLEDVMPPRVHVVSIHPELTNENQLAIKLVVAGDSRERALELVRKMEASKHFRQTEIQQETAEAANSGNQGDTVKLDISALYVPESPEQTAQGGTP
ncbi:MAG TPA: PilN domain-containing protein [Terriglobales bacterium]|nr:PilN domain-containing protein [Terriglobales bacterium]